jgi:O-antigen/teichoic acid export membrane protein
MLTHVLTPEAYGKLGLGMAIAALVGQIFYWPVSNGATRLYSVATNEKDVAGFFYELNKILVLSGVSVTAVFCLGYVFVGGEGDNFGLFFLVPLSVYSISSGCGSVYAGMLNAGRRRAEIAISQSIEIWTRFLLAYFLIKQFGDSSYLAFIGFSIASLAVTVWQHNAIGSSIINEKEINKTSRSKKWSSEISNYIRPFILIGIFTGLSTASDRWILNAFANTGEVGLYVVLYQLGYYPISMVIGVLVQLMEPVIYQRIGAINNASAIDNATRLVNITTVTALVIALVASLIALVARDLIFSIFTPTSYHSAALYLPIVVLSGGLFAAANALAMKIQAFKLSNKLLRPKIGMAIVGFLSNIVGAYSYGLKGIVFAGLFTSYVYLLLVYWSSKGLRSE